MTEQEIAIVAQARAIAARGEPTISAADLRDRVIAKMAERIEDDADIIDALQMELDIARGKVEVEVMSQAEIAEWLADEETEPVTEGLTQKEG